MSRAIVHIEAIEATDFVGTEKRAGVASLQSFLNGGKEQEDQVIEITFMFHWKLMMSYSED